MFKGKHKKTGQVVALKYIDITDQSTLNCFSKLLACIVKKAHLVEEISRESNILKMLHHPYIVKLYHTLVSKH